MSETTAAQKPDWLADCEAVVMWTDGSLRIAGTRVLLVLVLYALRDFSPIEVATLIYDALSKEQAQAIAGLYARHPAECEAYIRQYELDSAVSPAAWGIHDLT